MGHRGIYRSNTGDVFVKAVAWIVWIGAAGIFAGGFRANAEPPRIVDSRKQLFIDSRFIAASEGISLEMHPAQKMGPVVDESGVRVQGHISRVIDDGGKVRMYVGADRADIYESDDGFHFRATGESITGGAAATIFVDAHESDPAKRYKSFWLKLSTPPDNAVDGVYGAYSADGRTFEPVGRLLPYFLDNPALMFWDDRIGKYVVYTRALERDSENQRRIARIEMDNPLEPWPFTAADDDGWWASPRNIPVVMQQDERDDPYSDIYYNGAEIYPYGQDVYLMFTTQFRHFAPQRQPFVQPRVAGTWEDFGLLEIQLAVSRDGIHWERPSREAYIPNGLADEWDRWYTVMGPGMVRQGNYLLQYYYSSGMTHDSTFVRPEYEHVDTQLGGIGLVKQRLDGFVSAHADFEGGWLETPPLVFTGSRLRLNVDGGAMGTVFVEVRDNDGHPVPGFSREECEEIGGNFIDQTVYWKGNPDVSALEGQPVRLRFQMTRAHLYAFQFTAE